MTIDGLSVGSMSTFEVEDPATGALFATCPSASLTHLDSAVAAARRALPGWCEEEARRRDCLRACGEVIDRYTPDLALLITREQGKPLAESTAEVSLAADWFRIVSDLPLEGYTLEGNNGAEVHVQQEPFGVVGAITPWNFPVILAVVKVAPALLAGNTMVLKPSPVAPLSTLELVRRLSEVLPGGVLNSVAGGSEIGRAITEHSGINLVTFTGSVAVGREIASRAGCGLKKTVLELGGNDAAIVLPRTDVGSVAESLYRAAFANAGQFCVAVKRLFVHRSLAADLVEALSAIAGAAVVGNGLDQGTTLGPVTTRRQFDRLVGYLAECRSGGARFVCGGEVLPGPGHFLPPTLVTDVPDDAALVVEEQFGPVLPVLVFDEVEDALARANSSSFGLGGSVWGPDPLEAARVAARLACGTTWVNAHADFHPLAPFGGHGWSGVGYEYGPVGLAEFRRYRVRYEPVSTAENQIRATAEVA